MRLAAARGIRVHRSRLRPDEIGEVRGIPVTSVPRTLVDIAGLLDRRELERAWNEMEVGQLWDELPVERVVARHSGRRGIATLRSIMYSTKPEGRTRNELEERFVRLVDDHGLPRPRINAPLAAPRPLLRDRRPLGARAARGRARRRRRPPHPPRLPLRPRARPRPARRGLPHRSRHLGPDARRTVRDRQRHPAGAGALRRLRLPSHPHADMAGRGADGRARSRRVYP